MARKPRIHYPGALYHVITRGNNGEEVFDDPTKKNNYLGIVAQYKRKLGFKLVAFCIMSNHAHLLLQVEDVPLSKIMQGIQQVYTQWFNREYNRSGHVFQQRYKALLCKDEGYLLQLVRYIHNNPVRADLKGGIDYQWSSHLYYSGRKKGNLVDKTGVLGLFSNDGEKALSLYAEFMNGDPSGFEFEIVGLNTESAPCIEEVSEGKVDVDVIIRQICTNENIDIGEITTKTRRQKVCDVRKAIVLLSQAHGTVSNNFLARKLNLSASSISKIKCERPSGCVEEIMNKWSRE